MGTDSNKRIAIVLSGGGARGAYEAGVLSFLFERVYPQLPPGFEFDVVSGTSVGAIHAAYLAASAHMSGAERGKALLATWRGMALEHVLDVGFRDLAAVPLRALGFDVQRRVEAEGTGPSVIGGLVNVEPLERLVEKRIPWKRLPENLAAGRPGVLCIACTEVNSGEITVFMDGHLANTKPWEYDRYAHAIRGPLTSRHVRASAAIPFLFPAVRVDGRFYMDGGLRMNTPLTPTLRLESDKVLVVALKSSPFAPSGQTKFADPEAITQPAFLLGKVLNVLLLDQLEQELRQLSMTNALLEGASDAIGEGCIDRINSAIRAKRGVEYRPVQPLVVRPSEDLGVVAATVYRESKSGRSGIVSRLLARTALFGVPETEADLFSYIYFDREFADPLVELGRRDAESMEAEIVSMLLD